MRCVSSRVDGRHVGPVWELEWVAVERSEDSATDQEEVLVSVSGDGRVVQWTIRKEFKGNSKFLSLYIFSTFHFQASSKDSLLDLSSD